jgi:4-carboxymuconolactone decarboxylase
MRLLLAVAAITFLSVALAQAPSTRDLNLKGDRFNPLTYDQLTPEQKTLVDHLLAGERGGLNGPFNVLLRSPEMGDQAQKLGAQLRFHSSLSDKIRELAIIMTARSWNAQYEWYAHKRLALQVGLSPALIDAIAAGKRPASMQPDVEAAYDFASELMASKQVSDRTFQAAVVKLGERGVVDLTSLIGYYHMVSMLLNIDRYPLPDGVQPELKPVP